MIPTHLLANAKAYVSLIGAMATALLGIYGPETNIGGALVVLLALITAFSTWAIPNTPQPQPEIVDVDPDEPIDVESGDTLV